jgi:hypothetical protein
MSERGAFCTDFMCPRCAVVVHETLKDCLLDILPDLPPTPQPVLSGMVKCYPGHSGEEIDKFRAVEDVIQQAICHPVRIAVMADCGNMSLFLFQPKAPMDYAPEVCLELSGHTMRQMQVTIVKQGESIDKLLTEACVRDKKCGEIEELGTFWVLKYAQALAEHNKLVAALAEIEALKAKLKGDRP